MLHGGEALGWRILENESDILKWVCAFWPWRVVDIGGSLECIHGVCHIEEHLLLQTSTCCTGHPVGLAAAQGAALPGHVEALCHPAAVPLAAEGGQAGAASQAHGGEDRTGGAIFIGLPKCWEMRIVLLMPYQVNRQGVR